MMFCLLLLAVSPTLAQQRDALSAREIIDKMVSVYGSCHSYSDKGESKDVMLDSGRVTLRPFSTAFVRPSQFRFEFEEKSQFYENSQFYSDYVVWQNGATVKNWWSGKPEVRSFETLALALAAAAGVSRLSSILVPSMIFGDLGDSRLIQNLAEPVLVSSEKVGERSAYKIKGADWQGNEMTIWVDKEKFLLLKTFRIMKLANRPGAENTTTYNPEINADIAADKLAFKH
jgi:outer membrane lipoprotein-sorting protein